MNQKIRPRAKKSKAKAIQEMARKLPTMINPRHSVGVNP